MTPSELSPHEQTWLKQASTLSGVELTGIKVPAPPEWGDPDLVKEGQNFVKRHFFSVVFAHLLSLLFLLCYAPIRSVLIGTGKSHSAHNSKLRYFSTLVHIKKWYESADDLLLPTGHSPTLRDIIKVTRIHAGVAARLGQTQRSSCSINHNIKMASVMELDYRLEDKDLITALKSDLSQFRDPNNNDEDDILCLNPENGHDIPVISQLDMAVTQFCFMGFIPLFPKEFGFPVENKVGDSYNKGLEGFLHLWALFGHYLGIHPEFNLALPENVPFRRVIWTHVLLPHFSSCHPHTLRLWGWLIQGINSFIYCITLPSLLLFITNRLLKVSHGNGLLWGQLTFPQVLSFHLMRLCFGSWLGTRVGRIFFNALLRLAIWLFNLRIKLHIW